MDMASSGEPRYLNMAYALAHKFGQQPLLGDSGLDACHCVVNAGTPEKQCALGAKAVASAGGTRRRKEVGVVLKCNDQVARSVALRGFRSGGGQWGLIARGGCSHHAVLGVHHGCSLDAVREAFRRRALVLHPDMGGSRDALRELLRVLHVMVDAALSASGAQGKKRALAVEPSRAKLRAAAGAARAAERFRPKSSRCLERLVMALKAVTRDQRRSTLDGLPLLVRRALAAFMKNPAKTHVMQVETTSPCTAPPCACRATKAWPYGSIERVQRGDLGTQYRVAETVPAVGLIIKSQYVSSVERAIEISLVLVQVGVELSCCGGDALHGRPGQAATSQGSAGTVHRTYRNAILAACDATDMAASDLRLSFCPRVWCRCVRGFVLGRCTGDLQEALVQRDHLLEAGREGWNALRSSLISIRQSPTRKRLRVLDGEEAASRVDAAFERTLLDELQRSARATEQAFLREKAIHRGAVVQRRGHGGHGQWLGVGRVSRQGLRP